MDKLYRIVYLDCFATLDYGDVIPNKTKGDPNTSLSLLYSCVRRWTTHESSSQLYNATHAFERCVRSDPPSNSILIK